jgi:hypothetical protein
MGHSILALAPLISRDIVRQRHTWRAPAKQPGSRKAVADPIVCLV